MSGITTAVAGLVAFQLLGAMPAIEPADGSAPRRVPLSHDAIVPAMELLAQDVPEGIRPGAWMSAPHNCTMAFVVRDSVSRLYITTAGHCADFAGQEVRVRGHGLIGHVAATRWAARGEGPGDFALVAIPPEKYGEVDPRMAGWGGPLGLVRGQPEEDIAGRQYGWGYKHWFTHETRCREVTIRGAEWSQRSYGGVGALGFGDSGSPVILADGRAVGIVSGGDPFTPVVLPADPLEINPTFGGSRLDWALHELEKMTGLKLRLVDGGPPVQTCGDT